MRALLCAPWRAAKGLAAKMRGEGGTRPRGEAAAARGISNGAVPGLVENPWEQAALTPKYAALGQQDITTDVVVIGAGISGLSVAYNLVCAGGAGQQQLCSFMSCCGACQLTKALTCCTALKASKWLCWRRARGALARRGGPRHTSCR